MEYDKRLSTIELRFTGDANNPFAKALKKQMDLHKGVTIIDLVKFLYQSSLGPFPLLDMMDEPEIENWIEQSLEKAKPSNELLTEELYGRKWIRVNLRPYKKMYGVDFQRLFDSLMTAKRTKRPRTNGFLKLQSELVAAICEHKIEPIIREPKIILLLDEFLENHKKEGYPPIHHSEIYEKINNPEYLVVPHDFG